MYGGSNSASKRPRLDEIDESNADWDDDLPGEVFEEVAIMVEQSQIAHKDSRHNDGFQDQLKTKEGEIAILRAKLRKESEMVTTLLMKAKTAENKHNDNLIALRKQLSAELEFKDIEISTLSNRCKELEVKCHNGKLSAPIKKNPEAPIAEKATECAKPTVPGRLKLTDYRLDDGRQLADVVSADYFVAHKEPNPLIIYQGIPRKPRWVHLPKFTSHIQETYPIILQLFKHKDFPNDLLNKLERILQKILDNSLKILIFLSGESPQISKASEKLQTKFTKQMLLSNNFLCTNELCVELRRVITLISLVIKISKEYLPQPMVLATIKEIVVYIRKIQQIELSTTLLSILFFLETIFYNNKIVDNQLKKISQSIIEEIIFIKPEFCVLLSLFDTLSVFHKFSFCNKSKNCCLRILLNQLKYLSLRLNPDSFLILSEAFFNWLLSLINSYNFVKPDWIFLNDQKCCNFIQFLFFILNRIVNLIYCNESAKFVVQQGLISIYNLCKENSGQLTLQHFKLFPESLKNNLSCIEEKNARNAADWLLKIYDYQLSNYNTLKQQSSEHSSIVPWSELN